MINLITGISLDYLDSITAAVNHYNTIEGAKTFRKMDTINTTTRQYEQGHVPVWVTTITFETQQVLPSVEKHEYVGSVGIDPNDPDWKVKWESMSHIADR